MKRTISVDWLQLYCDFGSWDPNKNYKWIKKEFQTKQFKDVYDVIFRNELIATVVMNPISKIIRAKSGLIKFENRILYGQSIVNVVKSFLEENSINYIGLTRIDICSDFNAFFNNYKPESFIRDFLKDKILKNGRGKFTVIGEQKQQNSYQYIRFGEKGAAVNVYLYNKTVELKQVMDKPHVRKLWTTEGLNTQEDIWRLEVSIKSKGNNYIDMESGEYLKINYEDIINQENISNIFNSYISQYFAFKKNNGGLNKTRMEDLQLFDKSKHSFKPMYLPNSTGSTRAERIFLKKLYSYDTEIRGVTDSGVEAKNILLNEFVSQCNLNDFFASRKDQWERECLLNR